MNRDFAEPPTASATSSKAEGIVLGGWAGAAPHGGGNERAALHDRNPAAGGVAQRSARARARGRHGGAALADLRQPCHASPSSSTASAGSSCVSQQVHACAFGQASAALVERHAIGRTHADVSDALVALSRWLAEEQDEAGDWPGLETLAPARRAQGAPRRDPAAVPGAARGDRDGRMIDHAGRDRAGDHRDPRKRRDHARRGAGVRHDLPPPQARRDARLHRRGRADRPAGPAG